MSNIVVNARINHLEKDTVVVKAFGLDRLDPDKDYTVEFKPYKSSRSIEQNRKMWGIIQQIAEKTGNDEMDIYIVGLEAANVSPVWMYGLPEVEKELLRNFRAVKPFGTITASNGEKMVEMVRYKCYIGSSRMNTKEMTLLVDYFIRLAAEQGIEVEI